MQIDKALDKFENFFSWSWHAGIIWTLIKSVENEINGVLSRGCEHLLQATIQSIVAGFSCPIAMCLIDVGNDDAVEIGLITEL